MQQTQQLLAPMETADLWAARELLCHEMWQPTGQTTAFLAHHKLSSVSLPTGKASSVSPFITAICGREDALETCKLERKGKKKSKSLVPAQNDIFYRNQSIAQNVIF